MRFATEHEGAGRETKVKVAVALEKTACVTQLDMKKKHTEHSMHACHTQLSAVTYVMSVKYLPLNQNSAPHFI